MRESVCVRACERVCVCVWVGVCVGVCVGVGVRVWVECGLTRRKNVVYDHHLLIILSAPTLLSD